MLAGAGALWATRRDYRGDNRIVAETTRLLKEVNDLCGWKSRLAAPIVGRHLLRKLQQEGKRLAEGWTYEPPTFYEANEAAEAGSAIRVHGVLAKDGVTDPPPRGSHQGHSEEVA